MLAKAVTKYIETTPGAGSTHCLPLVHFIAAVCKPFVCSKKHQALLRSWFLQVCVRVGTRLDEVVCSKFDNDGGHGGTFVLQKRLLDMKSSLDRDRLIVSYWTEVQHACREHHNLPASFTFDMTQVGKRTILDCAVVWPSNIAAWLLPQVTIAESFWKGFSKGFWFVY